MFDDLNRKRDPATLIFYCGLVPFGLFWVFHRSLVAGFALQTYAVTVIVFVFYPLEIQRKNITHWSFWNRMLQVGAVPHLLFLSGLWYLDATYPTFVAGTGTVFFTAFVVGVIEMVVVGEILDRSRPSKRGEENVPPKTD
jgi:hypothetical protein